MKRVRGRENAKGSKLPLIREKSPPRRAVSFPAIFINHYAPSMEMGKQVPENRGEPPSLPPSAKLLRGIGDMVIGLEVAAQPRLCSKSITWFGTVQSEEGLRLKVGLVVIRIGFGREGNKRV
ncbi:hypothetical protein L6164_033757 [Bauhinia variegata]|uniref:Uncharacterized protein n=1 Tax=Bauhinia variegata TaxID=167791 RepID=A0ACB9KSM9_BAUVA|nr:hypothetical protein L6164_033757 [Bauhinia variegata]